MRSYILYSDIKTKDTIMELWGASTKHPDSVWYFSDFKKCEWVAEYNQILQWVLEIASRLTLPEHAYFLTLWILEFFEKGIYLNGY